MSNIVIKAEDLSKQYRLGKVGKRTLHDDLNRWLHRILGKGDPYLKVGEENDRSKKGTSDYIWALRNINFEVQQGEVLGIIGRNGAGKSTLLKILSKVTAPTTGVVKSKGKVASLLEVGTGFHPELSGRDNIFINGAILGMTKKEIQKKFDEIVDFSGVERYIDTPVKRYSSGMYVRLAFAVAAHLEPEILIVDEVLAVGDAEFQKKCLGKMNDVSEREGRTVLFVSHNMAAVSALTNRSFCMINGKLAFQGETQEAIKHYLSSSQIKKGIYENMPSLKKPAITRVEVITSDSNYLHINGGDLEIVIDVHMPKLIEGMALSLQILNSREMAVIYAYMFDVDNAILRRTGYSRYKCVIPQCRLYEDIYYLKVHLAESKGRTKFETLDRICEFEVRMMGKIIEWGWAKNVCAYTEDFKWEYCEYPNLIPMHNGL
jgi:lipopolysaccharide transport system ATP-binding protein